MKDDHHEGTTMDRKQAEQDFLTGLDKDLEAVERHARIVELERKADRLRSGKPDVLAATPSELAELERLYDEGGY